MLLPKSLVVSRLSLTLGIVGAWLSLSLPASAQIESTRVGPTGVFRFPVTLNNSVTFYGLIDTAATSVTLCASTANLLGLGNGGPAEINTPNGKMAGYETIIASLKIGKILIPDVPAIAIEANSNCDDILIGMSALRKLRRLVIAGDKIVLFGSGRHRLRKASR
jgi:clan AA aspartic protease (TIGR02281 family)